MPDARETVVQLLRRITRALKTYDEYRSRLWQAALRLFNGGKDASFISSFARSIDQQLTEAWNEGADAVGVAPEDMTEDDAAMLNGIIDNENTFLEGMGMDIAEARDSGMTEADFENKFGSRVDIWANRYNEVVNEAKVYFGGKQKLVWRLGATEKHCASCKALDGIVAWAQEWDQAGVKPQSPPNNTLECGGWNCDCSLDTTDQRRSANALNRIMDIATAANV